jgi:hypothetical protein
LVPRQLHLTRPLYEENSEEKEAFKTGQPNNVWESYKKYLDINELLQLHENNCKKNELLNSKKPEFNIADLLEEYLDSTAIWIDGSVYRTKRYIASTGDLQIHVYPKDHAPDHFHVISKQRRIDARFKIEPLELVHAKQGNIEEKDIKKIISFFEEYPNVLEKLKSEHMRMQGIN